MIKPNVKITALLLALVMLLCVFASCGEQTTEEIKPTEETKETESSGETEQPTGEIFEITASGDMTVERQENVFHIYVPNSTVMLSLNKYVKVAEGITWTLAIDVSMLQKIENYTVSLVEGQNNFYVFCTNESRSVMETYTVVIHRAGCFAVSFEGLTEVQSVVEGQCAFEPAGIPQKKGYVFAGWDYDFTKPVTSSFTVPAIWTAASYVITYDASLGTVARATQTVVYGEEVTLEIPTRQGYVFAGWYIGETVVKSGVWAITENVTLTARWVNKPFTVTFDPDGGMIDGSTGTVVISVEYGTEIVFPTPTKPGFSFGGWFEGETMYEGGIFEYTKDLNLKAKWNENSATITFIENGGEGGSHTENIPFGGILPTPVRENFTFGGWFFDEKLTEEALEIPDAEEPFRLYAWWQEEGKPVEFIYEISGLNYKVTERVDRNSTSLVPEYIGGLKTVDAIIPPNPNAGITLEKGTITVKIDRTAKINATLIPRYDDEDTTLIYSSSNELVATVDENGVVKGVASGMGACIITVLNPASGLAKTCYVAVLSDKKDPNAEFTVSHEQIQLLPAETFELKVTYVPEYPDDSKEIVFSSSDETIATVDASGKVEALALGDCIITISDADGIFEKSCLVSVVEKKTNENPGVYLDVKELTLVTNAQKTVNAEYVPEFEGETAVILWKCDNEAVATVLEGTVTAVGAGNCTITAYTEDEKYAATLTVTVVEPGVVVDSAPETLEAGKQEGITAHFVPENEGDSTELSFASDNEEVATVDGTGLITAHKKGVCTITVSSFDSKYSKQITLTVTAPKMIFNIEESDELKVEFDENVFTLTVPEDTMMLQMHKVVKVETGFTWILATDMIMRDPINNKVVDLSGSSSVTVYAYCHNADDSVMETYTIIINKKIPEYTLTLDPNGGTLEGAVSFTYSFGETLDLPVPAKENCNFLGWFEGDVKFESTTYDRKADLTLTAGWEEIAAPV